MPKLVVLPTEIPTAQLREFREALEKLFEGEPTLLATVEDMRVFDVAPEPARPSVVFASQVKLFRHEGPPAPGPWVAKLGEQLWGRGETPALALASLDAAFVTGTPPPYPVATPTQPNANALHAASQRLQSLGCTVLMNEPAPGKLTLNLMPARTTVAVLGAAYPTDVLGARWVEGDALVKDFDSPNHAHVYDDATLWMSELRTVLQDF